MQQQSHRDKRQRAGTNCILERAKRGDGKCKGSQQKSNITVGSEQWKLQRRIILSESPKVAEILEYFQGLTSHCP